MNDLIDDSPPRVVGDKKYFSKYFETLGIHISGIEGNELQLIVNLLKALINTPRKVLVAGNGGSAAIAGHLAVDLTKAVGIRAVNFTEPSLITCLSNDYGYERWIEKSLEFFADAGDLVVLISSSGCSENILNAARFARKMNLDLITLSGFASGNPLRKMGDVNLWVNSDRYNYVEITHQAWLLAVVDYLIDLREAA